MPHASGVPDEKARIPRQGNREGGGGGVRECVPFPVRLMCGECGKANESKNVRMRIIKENK